MFYSQKNIEINIKVKSISLNCSIHYEAEYDEDLEVWHYYDEAKNEPHKTYLRETQCLTVS